MMNFNSRTTYLAAVAQWKADYKAVSADLRREKLALKAAQRANDLKLIWGGYSALARLRNQANTLLDERRAGKVEAQAQYLAEKTAVTV